jgi:mono/diheme cytochrome c family protein
MPLRHFAIAFLAVLPSLAFAQNDSGDAPVPAVIWHFENANEPGLAKALLGVGPRPPQFPTFAATNQAITFDEKHPSVKVAEDDLPNANMRFGLKDSITIETWVKTDALKEGSYAYIVGKGRNGKKDRDEKNQNYALRLKGGKTGAHMSFLFASAGTKETPAAWHRWTTNESFSTGSWHHIAVVYTFGDSKSIRGYIDGKPVTGTWDMGGATDKAPVTDNDHLMIGTGNGGGVNNTFHGQLDDLAIWRSARSETTLGSRYQTAPPPPVLKRADVPKGQVLVQLCEDGMPDKNAWPDGVPAATESYREEAFGFFEVPHKYVDTGVRADRAFPMMMRAAAIIDIPAGKHRLLLRGRGASRLFIDNKLVMTTPFQTGDGSGHGHIAKPESYLNLGPDFRFAPPGNREATIEFNSPSGEQLVVLETMVGSFMGKSKRRPELGETVVAISPQGEQSWKLLAPTRTVPYTDVGWKYYVAEREANLERMNAAAREAKRKESEGYWNARRTAARSMMERTVKAPVPELPKGYPANNAIDHFLAVKIAEAKVQAASAKNGTVNFHEKILPILEAKCLSCHAGEKAKGGLQLDHRAAAFVGGDSDGAGIVPKEPGKSSILARAKSHDADTQMPPKGERLTAEQVKTIETWIAEGAHWPDLKVDHLEVTGLADDYVFIRRVYLDTVGLVPTADEVRAFVKDTAADKRAKLIDKLLADPRWADHWMGYWQDVLAENPNILNPTLNNTGPFRWWIYESLLDNKPMDLFVTELIRQQGSVRFGGPAGFGIASQNDAPMAAKGTIISTAFLGVEMKCARCHDAPNHKSTQKELFQLAAMLGGKSIKLPATSTVPLDKLHEGVGRKPLIQVTLKPGTEIEAVWPFQEIIERQIAVGMAENPNDSRDLLAVTITHPINQRFAQVMANRLWQRLMGRGIVATVDDWERSTPTHPELLKWLGREFVRGGYDMKKLAKLILNSHAYQRAVDPMLKETPVLYTARANRRLAAEQVVDSLFVATGKPMKVEECSLDIDGARDSNNSLTLGNPRRSWMLTSTSNERDRPSLALPRIQAVGDVLSAFGWRGTRQDPTTVRDAAPNVLQPAILQNGIMATWLTRLSDDHGMTAVALAAESPEGLVDELFLRILTRKPTAAERSAYATYLKDGFADRAKEPMAKPATKRKPEPYVSWSNHLDPQATVVRQQQEDAARAGDPPTDRLTPDWRCRMEDVLWAVLNSPEFVFTP